MSDEAQRDGEGGAAAADPNKKDARARRGVEDREFESLSPALSDAMRQVFGVIRTHGRRQLEHLARRGRERLDLIQARRDLDRLHQKLGREVVNLVEAGELDHPALRQRAARIRAQEEVVREAERQQGASPGAVDPAMDPAGDEADGG
ncbi:hypothetical protein L6R46_22400 [Myxococcota bacterium]|jgi:hypothetical protein|nr:hypothetical protein [Myxococcota bacterium]